MCGLVAQTSTVNQSSFLISVSVVGAIETPGIYKILPGSRVSEVLTRATQTEMMQEKEDKTSKQKQETEPFEIKYSQRNITLLRGEEEIKIDLQQYFILGNINANPILRDNDVIRVPAATLNLSITGAVHKPGFFEYAKGDRISDLIDLAMGITEGAKLEESILVRQDFVTGELSELTFSLSAIFADRDCADNLALMNGDRIYIRTLENYETSYSVTVEGFAMYPGEYAIKEGETTLRDILIKCGGKRAEGSLKRAYLQRISELDPELDRVNTLDIAEKSSIESEYQKFKMREMAGKIIVDFEALWNDNADADNIILEDNDYIFIPHKVTTVEVSGAVINPGAYDFESGKNYQYYIELAGGLSDNAYKRKVRIIREDGGAWQNRDEEMIIAEGDLVFVPEKKEIDYWMRTKDVFSILAQFATVILAIQSIYTN